MFRLSQSACGLLCSLFFYNIASGMFLLTLGKTLYDRTGSVVAFGLVIVLEFILAIVLQFIAGTVVDRLPPQKILSVSSLIAGVATLLFTGLGTPKLTPALAIANGVLINTVRPFYRTGTFVIIPRIATRETLHRLNGFAIFTYQIGQIIGISIAGFILEKSGSINAFRLVACLYLLAAISGWLINRKQLIIVRSEKAKKSIFLLGDWLEIVKILKQYPGIFITLILASGDLVAVAMFNLSLAPVVKEFFGDQNSWISVLDSMFAVGAVFGGILIASVKKLSKYGTVLVCLSQLLAIVTFLTMRFQASPGWLLGAIWLFGMAVAASMAVWTTNLQSLATTDIQGRLGALRDLAVAIVSTALVPIAAAAFDTSIEQGLSVNALVCFVLAVIVVLLQKR